MKSHAWPDRIFKQHENAGSNRDFLDYREGLRMPHVTRIATPIGVVSEGGRSGHGRGWYFYPNNLGAALIGDAHMKSFGKRGDAVAFVTGLLQFLHTETDTEPSMIYCTHPFGTRKPVVVAEVVNGKSLRGLVCTEDGAPGVAYALVMKLDEAHPNKGDRGEIEFTQGGPLGGYWKFFLKPEAAPV